MKPKQDNKHGLAHTVELPLILDLPEKMLPMIGKFNFYRYFLIEGGRGSGKTHSIARWILYLCEKKLVRVLCGRETQKSIEESTYALFCDLIRKHDLNFTITKNKIIHKETGSTILFKGFREQGSQNIKGLEGIDILWIDEAQSITKATLDIIIPTIRKSKSKIIFSMNRLFRNDACYEFAAGRKDCLHININYYDNKHITDSSLLEAEECERRNYQDFEHVWLGYPRDQAVDMLISYSKLDKAKEVQPKPDNYQSLRVMSVDLSAQGGDLCVASLIESTSNSLWALTKKERWSEPDTDITVGKVINIYSRWQPHILILDADGLGYPLYCSISKTIEDAIPFHGAGTSNRENAGNQRADGYLTLKEFFDNEWLRVDCPHVISQLETIKRVYKLNGKVYIQSKLEMKKDGHSSPDDADSLMMGLYGINYHAYLFDQSKNNEVINLEDEDYDPFA